MFKAQKASPWIGEVDKIKLAYAVNRPWVAEPSVILTMKLSGTQS